jgi:hypothetical protein
MKQMERMEQRTEAREANAASEWSWWISTRLLDEDEDEYIPDSCTTLSIPLFLAPSALPSPKKKPGKLNVKQCFHHGPIRAPAKEHPLTAPALIHRCRDLAHPPYAPGHSYLLFRASYFSNSLVFLSAHVSQASRTCS